MQSLSVWPKGLRYPGTKQMLTIPGIGVLTVAGFLAEVGDLGNYDHGQQIIRLAGLNLTENSSGKRNGKTVISKRGRSRLRGILFRAMLPMVAKNKEFKALHKYYTTRSRNPLKKKQSIIALCGKLVRILYTLGTKHSKVYNFNNGSTGEAEGHLTIRARPSQGARIGHHPLRGRTKECKGIDPV